MADLPAESPLLMLDPITLRRAAVSVADMHPDQPLPVATYLMQLGLAEHREDGTFVSLPDRTGRTWFVPVDPDRETLRADFPLASGQEIREIEF